MKGQILKKFLKRLSSRVGLVGLMVFFIWLKTLFAYFSAFKQLHSSTWADYFLMLINPIGFSAIFLTLTLFIGRRQLFYLAFSIISILGTLLVYGNVVYYREFSDFLTINTMVGGAGMVGQGFDFTAIPIYWTDIFYWLDLIILLLLFIFKKFKFDEHAVGIPGALKYFSLSFMVFALTFWMADMTEHRLISRQAQYDSTYVVRYLGLGPWLVTDGWYTHVANKERELATKSDFTKVQNYIQSNRYLAPNAEMKGIAKNRNVIEIHLESLQQDIIDLKIKGTDGKEHVVTPFLNSLYHSNSTYSFSNFFNQVGQGKTSDAETMLETSTFGLSAGSLFTKLGSTQTFQAMPAILNQTEGYSSAVFHGNVGSFYNRYATYRQMGYQNFFDQAYWDISGKNASGWGLKDKLLFKDSTRWLEQLQQPFYVKYLTVSNHDPYTMDDIDLDPTFKTVDSGNSVVDNYFLSAHYLDESVEEFFNYLKQTGLYNKSVIVLYGDHYGISGANSKDFAPYIGNTTGNFTDYDNAMMQRVPFMIHVPGQTDGYISDEFTGEIDVMPTLEHLLGIDTSKYIQFGQDIFAKGRQDFVALRNRGFITPTITMPAPSTNKYYNTKTGEEIIPNAKQMEYINKTKEKVNELLDMSDMMNTENLLRFYTPIGFTPVQSKQYSYGVEATGKRLKEEQEALKAKSTSLLTENHGVSSENGYVTNAPELKPTPSSSSSSGSSSSSSSSSSKSSKDKK